jgi:hypothetical protein
MVDDLLDKEILIGMSRAEVTDILGESGGFPPWTGEHWDRAYYLGSGWFLDTEWLAIRFHADGRVVEAEVVSYSG